MICFIFCRFLSWPWHSRIWTPSTAALNKGLIWTLCVRLSQPLHLYAAQCFVSGKAQLNLHVGSMCVMCFYIVLLFCLMSVLLFFQSCFCDTGYNAQGQWGRSVQIPSEWCFPCMKPLYSEAYEAFHTPNTQQPDEQHSTRSTQRQLSSCYQSRNTDNPFFLGTYYGSRIPTSISPRGEQSKSLRLWWGLQRHFPGALGYGYMNQLSPGIF